MISTVDEFATEPVTAQRWDDLEMLFGPNGAYSGCWCMYLRQTAKEFDANVGAGNRDRFARVVTSGVEPGLLAYRDGTPIGWVAIAPRDEYPRVLRSPLHRPMRDDTDEKVWSVTCFFIARSERGSGAATALLDAAVGFARDRGADAIEAYPSKDGGSAAEMWRGSIEMFRRAGFVRFIERKPGRPVLRWEAGA